MASLTACAAQPPLPTYRHNGIQLSGTAGGFIERRGECVLIREPSREIVPVWPLGTRVTAEGVRLPVQSGGALLRFGQPARLSGGHVHRLGTHPSIGGPWPARACGDHGFIVNAAEPILVINSAQDLAREADGILVGSIEAANFADRRQDGFLSTLDVRVTDVLKGPFRSGELVRVRAPVGAGLITAHDRVTGSKPADRVLLFTHARTYERQAKARGSTALAGFVGAGFGLFRIREGRIDPGYEFAMPETVAELKALIAASSGRRD